MTDESHPISPESRNNDVWLGLYNLMRLAPKQSLMSSRVVYNINVLDGFEDILGEALGEGDFYNTAGGVVQLLGVVAVSPNPIIGQTLEEMTGQPPVEVIKHLRELDVLKGMKVIDLGCGKAPGFALAAKALGAESWTVDIDPLRPDTAALLDGHIVTDLTRPNAAGEIIAASGGDFDVVTEHIVGALPFQNVRPPSNEIVIDIANKLMRPSGHFIQPLRSLFL